MLSKTIRLGQVAGIEIDVDYSRLVIFVLFVLLLGSSYFPSAVPGIAPEWYWLTPTPNSSVKYNIFQQVLISFSNSGRIIYHCHWRYFEYRVA